ncbi:MAG: AIDA repeat-containing protein [Alphaproteobacteria bacterium]|nr:AIDA repeat-containing protein [Alphaproteobacteria bacterium]
MKKLPGSCILAIIPILTYSNATAFTPEVNNGAVVNNEIVFDGLQIVSDGIANYTTINQGGEQLVWNNGIANHTIISNDGMQVALGQLGGTTTVNQGGWQILGNFSGDSFRFTDTDARIIINGGIQYIGEPDHGWEINIDADTAAQIQMNWGQQRIVGGSSIDGMTVKGESATILGNQFVFADGTATNTIVNAYGRQFILDGGFASDTIVNENGMQIVEETGIATGTIVNSNGQQRLQLGGTAESAIIQSGGMQYVNADSTAKSTTINNGGGQSVFADGIAESSIINDGAQQAVWGFLAGDTILNTDGMQFLLDGSDILTGATVTIRGGQQNIGQGSGSDAMDVSAEMAAKIIFEYGIQHINKDSSIDGMIVAGNGGTALQNVNSYGTATNTIVGNNGQQNVYSYAAATGTVLDGGIQIVYNSADVANTEINNGGQQTLFTGAIASDTIVNSGGTVTVNRGATLNGVTVNTGGTLSLVNTINGTVSNMNSTVNNVTLDGGILNMHGGGYTIGGVTYSSVANTTMITNGGIMNVGSTSAQNNATANNTTIADGTMNVYGKLGGTTIIKADGEQNLFNGTSFGTDANIVIDGGIQNVKSGLTLSGINVTFDSGIQNIESDATAYFMTISSSTTAQQNVYGLTLHNMVGNNGLQVVHLEGTANNSIVGTGGVMDVFGTAGNASINGGTQNFKAGSIISGTTTTIGNNGIQNIETGADIGSVAAYATINTGGIQNVIGTANYMVLNGGIQNVSGTAANTTVKSGIQNFHAGSAISGTGTIVHDGGIQNIESGADIGSDIAHATIGMGGIQNVFGIANNMIIDTGGTQFVNAGAFARNTIVKNYGTQIFRDNSTIGGTGNFFNNGGRVVFESASIGGGGGINADAETVLTFNNGRLAVNNVIGQQTHFHDTVAIRTSLNRTGVIELRLTNDGNDFYIFDNIIGRFNLAFMHSGLDFDLFNDMDSYDIIQNNSIDTSLAVFKSLGNGVDIGQHNWDVVTDYDTGITSMVKTNRASTLINNTVNFVHSVRSVVEKLSNSMHKRVGELQWLENDGKSSSGAQADKGIWARGIYKKSELSEKSGANVGVYGAEFGYDFKLKNSDSNKIFLGVLGYMASGDAEFSTANINNDKADLTAYGIGLYGIWLGADGWFADLALRQHFISQDITAYAAGFSDAVTYDSRNLSTSLNLNFGREFVFSGKDTMSWFLTPHAQINGAYISGKQFTMSNGVTGEFKDSFNQQIGIHAMGGPRWNMARGAKLQLYAKAGYITDLSDDSSVEFDAVKSPIERKFNAGGTEFGGGLNYRSPNKRFMLYIDAATRIGDQYNEISGTTGIRYEF